METQTYDVDFIQERLEAERREYAIYLAKHVLTAPFKATGVLVAGIGSAILHNMHEAYEDYELRSHDSHYGTNLYDRKQRQLVEQRTQRLVHKVGL